MRTYFMSDLLYRGTTPGQQARLPPSSRKNLACPTDTGNLVADKAADAAFGFLLNHTTVEERINVAVKKIHDSKLHAPFVVVTSKRTIRPNEQLRYNYKSQISKSFTGLRPLSGPAGYGSKTCEHCKISYFGKKGRQRHNLVCREWQHV
jgi:hypothetical protein